MGWCDKNLQIFEWLMEKEVEIIFKMAAKLAVYAYVYIK